MSPLSGWTVAVIGLGTMGSGMAHRLTDQGATVRAYNRTPGPVVTAATPADAARGADLVLVSVADDDALRAVLTGPDGVFAAAPPLVVNATTVAPATVRELGGPLVDAGVLGNGQHARDGLLRWYVGGPDSLVRQAQPVLAALGQQVRHVGALGDGMALKLVMNLVMGVEMQVLAEAVALGGAAGLDRQLVLDTITGSGFAAPVMRFKAARMAGRDYERPDFRLRHMAKDLALAVAQAGGTDLPMTAASAVSHAAAVGRGLGEQDCAAIVEQLTGARVGAR